jgi:hypothetical protein
MRTRTLLLAIVAGIALAGCEKPQSVPPPAPPPPPPPPVAKCTAQVCFIVVTVEGNCSDPNNIHVKPDTMPIEKNNHGSDPNKGPEIHWDIRTNGYTFASQTAIVFNKPPIPPPGEFNNAILVPGNTKYMMNDKNSSTASYQYTVNLLKDGTPCAPKDPFIANGK